MAKGRMVLAGLVALLAPVAALQALANAETPVGPTLHWNGFLTAKASLSRIEVEPPTQGTIPTFVVREPGPELARQAFAREPLAADALFVLATHARASGNAEEAARLAELVSQLEQRNRFIGVLRMQEALAAGDAERAFAVLDTMTAVNPSMAPALVSALAPAVNEPAMRDAIAGALEREPEWGEEFWTYSARNPAIVEGLLDLRSRVDAGATPKTDGLLLTAAINRELYPEALAIWERMTGSERGSTAYLPGEDYAPVGWLFEKNARKSVNATASGYSVFVARNANGAIGRQIVRLAPGTYEFAVEGDSAVTRQLQGALQCVNVAGEVPEWRDIGDGLRMTAGSGCSIYWLLLGADTFDERDPLDGKLSAITFRRAS